MSSASAAAHSAASVTAPVPAGPAARAPVGRRFVTSERALHAAMVLMHAHNDGLLFENVSNEFRVLFRASLEDSSSEEECAFEVAVYTDDERRIEKALKSELVGYFDDDSTYVVDSVAVRDMRALAADGTPVTKLMTLLNDVWSWRVCVCGKMFCKNDAERCLRCILTDTEEDLRHAAEPCLVCHDPCGRRFSTRMDCCGARMHTRCLSRWTAMNETCPHCRATMSEVITTGTTATY